MSKLLCQICTHAKAEEINAALTAGSKMQNQIAQEYGVSKASLSRHKARHLNQAATIADVLTLEAAKWAARADQIWQTATVADDTRGQAQACAAGLRALGMARQQEKAEQKAAPDSSPKYFRLEDIDKLFAQSAERTDLLAIEKAKGLADHFGKFDERETPEQRIASARLAVAYSDMYQLFEKCHENPQLRVAVLAFAREWQISKQGEIQHVSQQSTAAN